MSNKELKKLIDEFLNNQPDFDEYEWYCTIKEMADSVMDDFITFLKEKGKRL